MTRTLATGLVAAVAVALSAGCSGPNTPVRVTGTVTLDGKPLPEANVTFYRTDNAKEGRAAGGRTDAQGNFKLGTFKDDDGAIPGEYVIVVAKWESARPDVKVPNFPDTPDGRAQREDFIYKLTGDGPRLKNSLPAKYTDTNSSPLRATVKGEMEVQLELQSK